MYAFLSAWVKNNPLRSLAEDDCGAGIVGMAGICGVGVTFGAIEVPGFSPQRNYFLA